MPGMISLFAAPWLASLSVIITRGGRICLFFAKELDAVPADEADIEKAAKAGLRRLAEQRATYLLVYDNVASPEFNSDGSIRASLIKGYAPITMKAAQCWGWEGLMGFTSPTPRSRSFAFS